MAKVEKCAACGSYFNASVYSKCPYCSGVGEPAVKNETPAPHGGVLGRISSRIRRTPSAEKYAPEPVRPPQPEPMSGTDAVPETESAFASDAEVAAPLHGTQAPHAETPAVHAKPKRPAEPASDPAYAGYPQPQRPAEPEGSQAALQPDAQPKGGSFWHVPTEDSLMDVVSRGSRTVGKYISTKNGTAVVPVVGWLVGVLGDNYGLSFPLKSGKNRIGRSHEMDVKLLNDASVSRTCVAVVVYDQKANAFSVLPGESDSLCYLNGQALYGRELLREYDCLEFGGSDLNKYLFVPLCGERFRWKTAVQTDITDNASGDGEDEV